MILGRILGALGMAPYEVLVQATIADLYFVHERATRLAVWNLFLLCGICGAGFVSGVSKPMGKGVTRFTWYPRGVSPSPAPLLQFGTY